MIERAHRGERIVITKHGVPVAMLAPAQNASSADRKRAIAELKEIGKGRRLPEGVTIRDMIAEGRRF